MGGQNFSYEDIFGGGGGFADIFSEIFGGGFGGFGGFGGGGGGRPNLRRGENLQYRMKLGLSWMPFTVSKTKRSKCLVLYIVALVMELVLQIRR